MEPTARHMIVSLMVGVWLLGIAGCSDSVEFDHATAYDPCYRHTTEETCTGECRFEYSGGCEEEKQPFGCFGPESACKSDGDCHSGQACTETQLAGCSGPTAPDEPQCTACYKQRRLCWPPSPW